MASSHTRTRTLLLGTDPHLSRWGVIGAVGLFVALFALLALSLDTATTLYSMTFPLPPLIVIGIASVFVYYNRGVLVGATLSIALTYAFMIHLLHLGNVGVNPYPEAVIMALPFGLAIGGLLGVVGGLLGLSARRLTQTSD